MTFEERLDRIAERHEALTHAVELLALAQAKTEAAVLELEAAHAKTEAAALKTEAALRRAIRLGVREARNERVRRQDLANTVEGLAAMQKVTEEKLQRFLDSRLGGNGHAS